VAQCLEHLAIVHASMHGQLVSATRPGASRSVWQRIPGLPGFLGPFLVRSQTPTNPRKVKTLPRAVPSASDLPAETLERYATSVSELRALLAPMRDADAARTVMVSPIASFVVYSVLDGWRITAAHNWRHIGQARRVMQATGYPG
jgi:hypothetical protein